MPPKPQCPRCPTGARDASKHGSDVAKCLKEFKDDGNPYGINAVKKSNRLWPLFPDDGKTESFDSDKDVADAQLFINGMKTKTAKGETQAWSKATMEAAAHVAYTKKKEETNLRQSASISTNTTNAAASSLTGSPASTPNLTSHVSSKASGDGQGPTQTHLTAASSAGNFPDIPFRFAPSGSQNKSVGGDSSNGSGTGVTGQGGGKRTRNKKQPSSACVPGPRLSEPGQSHRDLNRAHWEMPVQDDGIPPEEGNEIPEPLALSNLEAFYEPQTLQDIEADRQGFLNLSGSNANSQTSEVARAKTHLDYHALRPSFAPSTTPFDVVSNHFEVKIKQDTVLYEYHVSGFPTKVSRAKRRVLILDMMETNDTLWNARHNIATNYFDTIIASTPLCGESTGNEIKTCVPNYNPGTRDQATGQLLTLHFIACHNLNGLQSFVEGTNERYTDVGATEAMNIVIAKVLTNNNDQIFQTSRNRFYFRPGWKDLQCNDTYKTDNAESAGLVSIRGYVSKIKPAMGSILLNVNTLNSTFYKAQPLHEYLNHFYKFGDFVGDRDPLEMEEQPIDPTELWNRAQAHIRGLRAYVNFSRNHVENGPHVDDENRRIKTLVGLGNYPKGQIITVNAAHMTVWEHIRSKYGLREEDVHSNQKTGNVGQSASQNQKFYAANQLTVLSDQPYRRSPLPSEVTRAMIDNARRTPFENYKLIMREGVPQLGLAKHAASLLDTLGISIVPSMVRIPARLIDGPTIQYLDVDPCPADNKGFWVPGDVKFINTSHGFSNQKSKSPVGVIQYFCDADNAPRARLRDQYHANLTNALARHGLQPLSPVKKMIYIQDWTVNGLRNSLSTLGRIDLAVVIFTKSDPETRTKYAKFKIVVDQLLGMKSICFNEKKMIDSLQLKPRFDIRSDTLGDEQLSNYMRNIAMKLNLRCGNYNHTVPLPGLDSETIILGADVTHPGGGSLRGTPSIAAVVSSVDQYFARFPGSMRLNPSREEIIKNMKTMVEQRLRYWYSQNDNTLPTKEEVLAIRAAWEDVRKQLCPDIYSNNALSITAIVVTKRHNTRLYPYPFLGKQGNSKDESKKGRNTGGKGKGKDQQRPNSNGSNRTNTGNCLPGTVVDSGITSPYYFDFFLQSHHAPKGSAKPAHYFVLENEIGFGAKELQDLTFNLCHMYGRSTNAVSYAPPAYYADRLCERGRLYLQPFHDWAKGQVGAPSEKTVKDQAKLYFYPNGENNNPWHPNHEGKMFWM